MGKHDFMSPKDVANRMKAKGLQRLRWYCQMCEKQCRDQNGFKCHCASESHQRQMSIFAENPERYMEQFSQEFEQSFISILSRRYGTKKVHANQVYQEIVADRQHLHMNATKWDTLSDFVMYLGKGGKCRVEESERGWVIEWIDTSDEALARKAAILKKERQEMDDEQRENRLLQEQIERAKKAQMENSAQLEDSKKQPEATELKRESADQPIKLEWKKAPGRGLLGRSTGLIKANKLTLKPNPFKIAAAAASVSKKAEPVDDKSASLGLAPKPAAPKKISAVEEIMLQEQVQRERLRDDDRGFDKNTLRRRSRSPLRR
ncbi:domain of Kin17 curved DNA-binding protein-domain-containing protein [Kickxella alabastrina]|uniref:domain of Kin17 curved DNA-binding protein-domain-containing protein n=1 Tax=Kickxella alabastrina TaxID=61397 RepID=UPI00221EB530|nr:domain of Kin17 curved DNA-binding protein-domain-containing protein [Kickxella alabastrina]KAI7833198.1 domain of Kin17 curved DNA-binding protein-domain-containing protein [Kickxella alabastrina]KAJ1940843.1 hypothetical protein GGF37_003806 [Kickxella alabastrina]